MHIVCALAMEAAEKMYATVKWSNGGLRAAPWGSPFHGRFGGSQTTASWLGSGSKNDDQQKPIKAFHFEEKINSNIQWIILCCWLRPNERLMWINYVLKLITIMVFWSRWLFHILHLFYSIWRSSNNCAGTDTLFAQLASWFVQTDSQALTKLHIGFISVFLKIHLFRKQKHLHWFTEPEQFIS